MKIVTLGLIQMMVGEDKKANLSRAEKLTREAVSSGAQVVMLPEMFNGPYDTDAFASYAEEGVGETRKFLSSLAKELGIVLIGGSFIEREGDDLFNTSFVYDEQGAEIHRHRKVHLFDIDVPGGQYFRESDVLTAGDAFGVFDTSFGTFGLAICFDVRFSSEFTKLAKMGAQMIFVPAAFNMTTGPAHWQTLFRARALDHQLFMVGVSPAGNPEASYQAWGHSIVTNPWGEVVMQLGCEEGVAVVQIDLGEIDLVRQRIPVFHAL